MEADIQDKSSLREQEREIFKGLTAKQRRYVQLWIAGGKTKQECYREAYGWKGRNPGSLRSCCSTTHNKPKIQEAIFLLTSMDNKEALCSRHEKRMALSRIIRAHSPQQRAINPSSPYLRESLPVAIKLDNEMAGHNAPTEVVGEVTLSAILADLNSSPLVKAKNVGPRPIPAAGGGFGVLPEHQENGNGTNGDEEEPEPKRAALEIFDDGGGVEAFKKKMAKNGKHPFKD